MPKFSAYNVSNALHSTVFVLFSCDVENSTPFRMYICWLNIAVGYCRNVEYDLFGPIT